MPTKSCWSPEEFDAILTNIEDCVSKFQRAQESVVQLSTAELNLLGQLEAARDFMDEMMRAQERRSDLESIFGGDCVRISRIRAVVEGVRFSDMNKHDQRLSLCLSACESVENVLLDLGLAVALHQSQQKQRELLRKKLLGCNFDVQSLAPVDDMPTEWVSILDHETEMQNPEDVPQIESVAEDFQQMLPCDGEIQSLMSRADHAFKMLMGLLQTAASERESDRPALERVQVDASEKYRRAGEETRYILFGGLVSAGKTTLVNALIRLILPELHTELKKSPGLLPSDYNENTAIVTEVRLSPTASSITTTLMRATCGNTDDGDVMPISNLVTSKCEFEPAPGYPKTYPNSGCFRKLQKDIKSVIEKKSESESTMMKLVIEIPCAEVGTSPLSIIDTPGLDSPLVWQQVREEVNAKAFVFVWVGALDSPATFGLQGRHLLELYHKTGQILPPVLAVTKWDLLKQNPHFSTPKSRLYQAQRRINELRAGLCPKGAHLDVKKIACFDPSDLTSIRDATRCVASSGIADTSSVQWILTKNVAIAGQMVSKGSVLTEVWKDMELICDPKSKISFLEDMLQFQLPVTLTFTTAESEMPVMLAATDAPGFLAGRETDANIPQLWSMLQKLLRGLADPMRLSKRLTTVMEGTQQCMNILLRTDPTANIFEHRLEELKKTKEEVINKFSDSMDGYFLGFPSYISQARFEDAKSAGLEQRDRSEVCCLVDYTPPRGLSSDECAICQLPRFIHYAHEDAKACQGQDRFAYVKAVAEAAIRSWHEKCLENIHRYEKECQNVLEKQIFKEFPLNCDYNASRYWTPNDWQQHNDLLGGLCGIAVVCCIVAIPFAAVELCACAAVLMGSFGLRRLKDASVAKKNGFWDYKDARQDAMQSVLEILSEDSFKEYVKNHSIKSFVEGLEQYMGELEKHRSMDNSDSEESRVARHIRQEVEESIFLLRAWFARFVSGVVTKENPWIVRPPEELMAVQLDACLIEDDDCSSASDTEESIPIQSDAGLIEDDDRSLPSDTAESISAPRSGFNSTV